MRRRALLLALFALAGCARPAEKVAAKAVVELLPGYLGPADSWRASVKGDSLGALMRGRVRTVHIDGRGVKLTPELTLAELRVDADEVEVDRGQKTLKSVGQARFEAGIDAASLDHLARARRPKLADLRLRLTGDALRVTVTPEVLGYPTVQIEVTGNLAARDGGGALDFEPEKGRLSIVPIPGPVLEFVMDRLNPLVDLRGLSVPIRVARAEVRAGRLWLTGSIPPEEIVRRSREGR